MEKQLAAGGLVIDKLFYRPCPVCHCGLDISVNVEDDSLSMRSEQLPALYRDKEKIVNAYKRVKKFGSEWDEKHKTRGVRYAADILSAIGEIPQAADVACAAVEWYNDKMIGKKWDMGDIEAAIPEYLGWRKKVAESKKLPRCGVCGENFRGAGERCSRHEGM